MGKNDSFSPPDGSVQDFLGPILAVDRVLQDLYQILYAIQDVEDSLQDINVPGIDHHTLRLSDQVRRLIAATQLHNVYLPQYWTIHHCPPGYDWQRW